MDIKVREVTDVEEKSSQQIEQELLEKHEQKQEATEQPVEVEEVKEEVEVQEDVQKDDSVSWKKVWGIGAFFLMLFGTVVYAIVYVANNVENYLAAFGTIGLLLILLIATIARIVGALGEDNFTKIIAPIADRFSSMFKNG